MTEQKENLIVLGERLARKQLQKLSEKFDRCGYLTKPEFVAMKDLLKIYNQVEKAATRPEDHMEGADKKTLAAFMDLVKERKGQGVREARREFIEAVDEEERRLADDDAQSH